MGDKKLGDVFGFDEADLALNRAGQLAPSQEKLIRKRANTAMTLILSLAVPMIVPFLPLVIFSGSAPGLGTLLVLIACVFVGLLCGITTRNMRADLHARRVLRLFDRIELSVEDKRRSRLKVQGKRFRITSEQLLALRHGQYYAVYVTPASRTIVSVEPVDMTEEADTDAAIDVSRLAESEESVILTEDGEIARRTR